MCRNYKRKGNIRLQKKALAEKNISAENPCLAEKSVLMEKNGKSKNNILAVIGGMGSGKGSMKDWRWTGWQRTAIWTAFS